jgi:hypothetical protein
MIKAVSVLFMMDLNNSNLLNYRQENIYLLVSEWKI